MQYYRFRLVEWISDEEGELVEQNNSVHLDRAQVEILASSPSEALLILGSPGVQVEGLNISLIQWTEDLLFGRIRPEEYVKFVDVDVKNKAGIILVEQIDAVTRRTYTTLMTDTTIFPRDLIHAARDVYGSKAKIKLQ